MSLFNENYGGMYEKIGEIVLEIDNDEFDGVTVTAGEFIEVSGEVDKEMMKPTKVDVKTIKKLSNVIY